MNPSSLCATAGLLITLCLSGCSGDEPNDARVDTSALNSNELPAQGQPGNHGSLDPVDWFLYQNTWAIGNYDRSALGGTSTNTISTAFLRSGPFTPRPDARVGDCIFKSIAGTGDVERNAERTPNYGLISLVSGAAQAFLNYDTSTSQYVPDLSAADPFALDSEYRVVVAGGPSSGPGEGKVKSPPHLTAANVDIPSPWLHSSDNTAVLRMPEDADLKDVAFMMVIYESEPTFGSKATICVVPAERGVLRVPRALSSFYSPAVSYRGQFALARRTQVELGGDMMTVMVRSTFLYDFQMQ